MKKKIFFLFFFSSCFTAVIFFYYIRMLETAPPALRYWLTDNVSIDFILVPAGTFMMGTESQVPGLSPDYGTEEHPAHRVTVTKPFYLGRYELTQQQWETITSENPSSFKSPDRPVERISYEESVSFCENISSREKIRFRLPTEAEWEYACRAGTTSHFYWGNSSDEIELHCNFADRYASESSIFHRFNFTWGDPVISDGFETTSPAGSFRPNPWGFYDMCGNVWEWCSDWFSKDYYASSPVSDPAGPETGDKKVIRGGAWGDEWKNCRSASRASNLSERWWVLGARLVMEVPARAEISAMKRSGRITNLKL